MLSNVPQFIDTEDKIVGPLTAKQLGWLAAGAVLALIAWNMFDMSTFIVIALVLGGIFGALAFYRPYNQPLLKFLLSSVYFVSSPRIYVWKRNYDSIRTAPKKINKKKETVVVKKTPSNTRIADISKMLDNQNL